MTLTPPAAHDLPLLPGRTLTERELRAWVTELAARPEVWRPHLAHREAHDTGGTVVEHRLRLGGEPAARVVRAGSSFPFGPDHIHRTSGEVDGLVSIHAYSPPLWRMGQYAVSDDGVMRRLSASYADELRSTDAVTWGDPPRRVSRLGPGGPRTSTSGGRRVTERWECSAGLEVRARGALAPQPAVAGGVTCAGRAFREVDTMAMPREAPSSPATDQALTRLLEAGQVRARATDPEHARLWDALAGATEGGKRFRPALVLATHDALGGASTTVAVEVAAAVELLHTAFVVHDDVIDGDDHRRGRPNVSGTFRAHALAAGASEADAALLGRTAGVLAGDLALAAAIRAVATCGATPAVTHRLLDLFDAALHTTAAGELADVRLSLGPDAALTESLLMAEQKTSAYSFALPVQAGAVLAGADERTVAGLGEVGRVLGLSFQLLDDLLGVFGDPAETGKSASADLRAAKQTPLLAHARTTPQWPRIRTYVGRDLADDELGEVRGLLVTSGSRGFVQDLARSQVSAARAGLEALGIGPDLLGAVSEGLPVLGDGDMVAA